MEIYLKLLDQAFYEMTFAFEGLADENVWKRPAAGLLSVGELAGHVAYWDAVRLSEAGEDPEKFQVSSLLIDPRFRYLPKTLATPPSEQHLSMTAEHVGSELQRVHQEAVAHFKGLNPDLDSNVRGSIGGMEWTYRTSLEYLVFHVAYHTGQIYSVRHLLGEEPPNN